MLKKNISLITVNFPLSQIPSEVKMTVTHLSAKSNSATNNGYSPVTITVNAVAPGFIETEMVEGIPLDQIAQAIPAGRLGKPEEVASAVLFLCSKQAAYITGQVLGINGGIC